jgi:peroxiredoxin
MLKALAAVSLLVVSLSAQSALPAVGDRAKDFTLNTLDGTKVTLSSLYKKGPVVVLMLRGWVGYQCPFCNRQVGDFIQHAKDLEAAGTDVVLVYPGSADLVDVKASDFVSGKTMPANLHFVTDPELKTVNLYNLRWDAPGETAYPTTLVIDKSGVIRWTKISKSHGDRSTSAEVLAEIAKLK